MGTGCTRWSEPPSNSRSWPEPERPASPATEAPVRQARLSDPSGVAVAPNGDVYFEDGNRVRKVSAADGVISTVAGDGRTGSTGNGGPAIRASLNFGGAQARTAPWGA